MRRVYFSGRKPSAVKQRALEQLRQTRAKISADHPGLLSSIRDMLTGEEAPGYEEDLSIDRVKNLKTVMKFLEAETPRSPQFEAELLKMLKENRSSLN